MIPNHALAAFVHEGEFSIFAFLSSRRIRRRFWLTEKQQEHPLHVRKLARRGVGWKQFFLTASFLRTFSVVTVPCENRPSTSFAPKGALVDNKTIPPELEHFLAVQSAERRKTECQDCGATLRHKELEFFLPTGRSYTIHLPICPRCRRWRREEYST
jgi:hypothetical protein